MSATYNLTIMCGRYALAAKPSLNEIEQEYFSSLSEWRGTYNAPPTVKMPMTRRVNGDLQQLVARWGLVPSWAKDAKTGYSLHNARAETLTEKPAYRRLLKSQRCLVPATGFFEWQQVAGGKQPWLFGAADGSLLVFAGLWDHWERDGRDPITSFTIIVCGANPLVHPVHDRMPVILPSESWDPWLSGAPAEELLLAAEPGTMRAYPVSRMVNNVGNNDPRLMDPAPAAVP